MARIIKATRSGGKFMQAAEEIYRELPSDSRNELDELIRDTKAAAEMYGVRNFGLASAFELVVRLKVWLGNGGAAMIETKEVEG